MTLMLPWLALPASLSSPLLPFPSAPSALTLPLPGLPLTSQMQICASSEPLSRWPLSQGDQASP